MTTTARFLLVFLFASLAGCGGTDNPVVLDDPDSGAQSMPAEAPPTTPPRPAPAQKPANPPAKSAATSPSGLTAKVKIKGRTSFSIKPMHDGAKLVDATDQELARYTVREQKRVKVKDAADKPLGQVKGTAAKLHVTDAAGIRIFALQRQSDGDYKLEDGREKLLFKIKQRDYGWKIEDASGKEFAKVKTKGGKTSLRDPGDQTLLSTKNPISQLAMACLAFEAIERPLRVALAIRVQAEGLR